MGLDKFHQLTPGITVSVQLSGGKFLHNIMRTLFENKI